MTKKTESTENKDDDLALIHAIKGGDNALFERLVDKYMQRLYNFGLKICKNSQDAEDLVQESFINVHKYLKDFREEASFKNWLYRIAASVCWKMRRKSKFAPDRELSLEEFMPKDHAFVDKDAPAWAHEPISSLLNRELNDQIETAVSNLPKPYRLVLVLRDMEGFSTEETARILSLSESNVKVRLHRARLFVREALKEYYDESQP